MKVTINIMCFATVVPDDAERFNSTDFETRVVIEVDENMEWQMPDGFGRDQQSAISHCMEKYIEANDDRFDDNDDRYHALKEDSL